MTPFTSDPFFIWRRTLSTPISEVTTQMQLAESCIVFASLLGRIQTVRKTQEGCGGLGGENPAAFPKARPIFQQPFSLPENAQTLAGIAFRAAGKSVKNFPAASKFAGKLLQQAISDSHSLLEFSETGKLATENTTKS